MYVLTDAAWRAGIRRASATYAHFDNNNNVYVYIFWGWARTAPHLTRPAA